MVSEVRVHALNENTALRETLGVDLATDVEKTDAASDVTSRLFDDAVSVYVGEESETKSIGGAGVSEPVHREAGFRGVEHLSDSVLHLVVVD